MREGLLEDYAPSEYGALYAAMINFTGNPDIGTAQYTMNDDNFGNLSENVVRPDISCNWIIKLKAMAFSGMSNIATGEK